ncbi:hypothetical protein JTE90_018588 [Oedothorax gibbosus]|uniref:Uncharacterized protein n=1 Tax=Oedothorax gibbosus TaxID=931172 RepID=A0AAV6TMG1_9ARAC|nr:hypothetical protein JTE90_018588 [Oedothorax gibbosus]
MLLNFELICSTRKNFVKENSLYGVAYAATPGAVAQVPIEEMQQISQHALHEDSTEVQAGHLVIRSRSTRELHSHF